MSSGFPEGHPDQDLLADLAAEVLSPEQALPVERHVVDCAQCSTMLARAESVRDQLAVVPPTMPSEVWARLEARLLTEARVAVSAPSTEQAPPDYDEAGAPTMAFQRFRDEVPSTTSAAPDNVTALEGRRPRLQSVASTRRENRTDSQALPFYRRPALLAMAAGAAGILVAGGIVVSSLGSGDDGSSVAAAANGALPLNAVRASGQNYSASQLQEQSRELVRKVTNPAQALSNSAAATATVPVTGSTALQDPEILKRCLAAVKQGTQSPVAVDLGRYEGREAAVIVFSAEDGGYDVVAVERSCGSGQGEEMLGFKHIAAK